MLYSQKMKVEKARFQGIVSYEYYRYSMRSLSASRLSDFAGNSFFGWRRVRILFIITVMFLSGVQSAYSPTLMLRC